MERGFLRKFLVFCLLLLLPCSVFCSDGTQANPLEMTELQIYTELESLLVQQLTQSQTRQENLQSLQTTLESSLTQLDTLQSQLRILQEDSTTLKSSLSCLNLSLEQISTGLRESESSLQSLSEDMKRQADKARIRETILVCVCGVSLGTILVMLVSGLIRN